MVVVVVVTAVPRLYVCKSTRLGSILYLKRDQFRATNTFAEVCMVMLMLVQLQTVL